MSNNTLTPRPADWAPVEGGDHEGGELYAGPEYLEPGAEWGVRLLWDRDGLCYGVSSDTDTNILSRTELLELRTAIEKALQAGD